MTPRHASIYDTDIRMKLIRLSSDSTLIAAFVATNAAISDESDESLMYFILISVSYMDVCLFVLFRV